MRLPVDHFGLIARWYSRLPPPSPDELVYQLLAARPGDIILDAGGGTGRNTRRLAAQGSLVMVCDPSSGMLRRVHGSRMAAVRGTVTRLPLLDGSVDRIVVVDAFHHFVDPSPAVAQPSAARELLRVLKPGGRLVIEEPDIRQTAVVAIAVAEKVLLMGSRFLSPAAMIRLFESMGARTIDRRYRDGNAWLAFSHD